MTKKQCMFNSIETPAKNKLTSENYVKKDEVSYSECYLLTSLEMRHSYKT